MFHNMGPIYRPNLSTLLNPFGGFEEELSETIAESYWNQVNLLELD